MAVSTNKTDDEGEAEENEICVDYDSDDSCTVECKINALYLF
jgi:hypothetical protein